MTIWEAIDALEAVPESKRHLPLFVWHNDHVRVIGITPFDTSEPHSESNPLGVDLDELED